tara:strand:- start:517 stop:687 length:171 start_codon:yes stop_codon:yes gene_type:complete
MDTSLPIMKLRTGKSGQLFLERQREKGISFPRRMKPTHKGLDSGSVGLRFIREKRN